MMKILLIITISLCFLYLILFTRVNIYLNNKEKFNIEVKIGRLFKFKIGLSKIIKKIPEDINQASKTLNNTKIINKLLKEIDVLSLTVTFNNNIFLDTYNIYTGIMCYIINNEIDEFLNKHFNLVNNVYYSVNYLTIGSFNVKFEGTLETKVYRLIKGLLRRGKYERRIH